MPKTKKKFPRGAEWRQWDFHVHTPASFEWTGPRFAQMTEPEVAKAIDEMIKALNESEPAVFVIMDYWTFDGWFALKKRLGESGAPELTKKVFPGIELRLVSPTTYRLNAHVVFSDEVSDQDLNNFKAKLEVALINQPLSDECLVRLAREKLGDDLLRSKSFIPSDVASNAAIALMAGSKAAEISTVSYREAITKVPGGKAIGFMPWETNDGLSKADWKKHYAFVIDLMNFSTIFETRRPELWAAFTGTKTDENKDWIEAFQAALENVPRLAVSGSDAHRFVGIKGDNDKRGYGDFPSGKATWIKADPTFLGLLQAIKEPSKRSFIGQHPPKVEDVVQNKTFYIDAIRVEKNPGSAVGDHWLSDCNIYLNPDLVAIIGNKGSGKSALADIIALLGNTRQKGHFSFLSDKRFRQKPKELAKHFTGTISWCDSSTLSRSLSQNPPEESVELVRYIPQAHFEKLCNDHISGESDVFEKELRAVIFSHTNASTRQKALNFDQLIDQQERTCRDNLGEYRKDLRKINHEVEGIEGQLQPEVRRALDEQLAQIQKQIDEHKKIEPPSLEKPSEQLTSEQRAASEELDNISKLLEALDNKAQAASSQEAALASKTIAIQGIRERLRLLDRQYKQFNEESASDFKVLGIEPSEIVSLSINDKTLDDIAISIPAEQGALKESVAADAETRAKLVAAQTGAKEKLNGPQQLYQQRLRLREVWQEKLRELTGNSDEPETLEGIKARIEQLKKLPDQWTEKLKKRLEITGDIFDVLESQRKLREDLFKPVQDLIQGNSLIRDEYKLQFQATLSATIDALTSRLFELIKQNSGEFRGESESHDTIKKIAEQYDFNKKGDVLSFVAELHSRIVAAANQSVKAKVGIASMLRTTKASVDKTATDVYDLLFGLPFIEPRYSLLFQETHIEQLSPGQRGALLLIFYLLVDKGRTPIILDQPEENLDNETVVSLLVPVLCEAKKRRQIIMVTHNPNLAVVCDAEQVIHSSFDRKSGSKITYTAGSIESPQINSHVVNVLEGTKPAFDNRRVKYH
ncbi:ABC transporter [Geoanaerobacter pelophilus]|uniref:ABC transporter n=1 Tax=Geoanaerobacter pelophilus TaxID=60036 RepID=A0ABQ0MNV0_9BACT|nr:AAA family ATPase [Geoanaerobacter pelophilus]GAW68749.1 ABC transporter [Geoanaerobacter pelophilus]